MKTEIFLIQLCKGVVFKLEKLTDREQTIFDFICEYHKKNGYSPCIREIQKGVYLQSPNQIHRYLIQLMEKEYITITPNVARSIVIKALN